MQLALAQEGRDAEIAQLATRCGICFMLDKHIPSGRIAAKEPPIPIRAAVKLPFLHAHPPLFAPDVRQPGCAPFHLVSFVCQLLAIPGAAQLLPARLQSSSRHNIFVPVPVMPLDRA
jgi:hypothetical protein